MILDGVKEDGEQDIIKYSSEGWEYELGPNPGIRMESSWKKCFPSNLIVSWDSETIGRPRIRDAKWRCFSNRSKPYM